MNVYPKRKQIEGEKLKPFLIYSLLLTFMNVTHLIGKKH